MTTSEAATVVSTLNKKFGAGTIVLGSEINQPIPRMPSGSLTLDYILGGGWPANQWNEIIGEFSAGKTALALQTIAANQKRDPEWTAVWISAEPWVNDYALMNGVDTSRVIVVSTNIMEEAYGAAVHFAESKTVDCIVIDSLPALSPDEERGKEMDEFTVGRGALITNKFWRKVGSAMRRSMVEDERPVLGLLLNQWRMKIGVMHGDPRTRPGGKGLEYAMFTIVEVKRDEWIEVGKGESKRKVGQRVRARTMKNKTYPPQQVAYFDYYFDDGGTCGAGEIDFAKETVAMALVNQIITRGGAWFYYGDRKWQGVEALLSTLREEIDLKEEIEKAVMDIPVVR